MKRFFLSAIVAVIAMTANAQIWVGGELGFTYTDFDSHDESMTSFVIAPEVGYTLNEKWDIAIALGDRYSKMKNHDATNDIYVNPYARYTFFKTGKVGFFVDGGFSILTGDSPTEFGVGIRPGIKFAASDKVTLVASFGGLGYKKVEDSYSQFGFDVNGNKLMFGCYYSL